MPTSAPLVCATRNEDDVKSTHQTLGRRFLPDMEWGYGDN
jgi:hypothetical protein